MKFFDSYGRFVKSDKYPRWIKAPILIVTGWIFQGILYMDKTERTFKLILDITLLLPIYVLISILEGDLICQLIIALFIAHTINLFINGQVPVMMKNLGSSKIEIETFTRYLEKLRNSVSNEESIVAAAAFGSLSRDKISERSDLDIRLIRRKGVVNGLRACSFVMNHRFRSTIRGFPLDIYVLDGVQRLSRISPDEAPIILLDRNAVLKEYYEL